MPDGLVKQNFDGDPTKLEKAYDVIYRQNAKLMAKMQEMVNQSKEGHKQEVKQHEEKHNMMEETIHHVERHLAQIYSLEKAVEILREGYAEWNEEMKQVAESGEQFNTVLVRSAVLANRATDIPHLKHFLENIGPGVTREKAAETFEAVREGAPDVSSTKIEEATRHAAQITRLGLTPGEIGRMTGEILDIAPDQISGKGAAQMAFKLRKNLSPEEYDKLRSARQMGPLKELVGMGAASPYEGLALATESAQHDQPRLIGDLTKKVAGGIPMPKTHGRSMLTPSEQAIKNFNAASKHDRLQMLLSDQVLQDAAEPDLHDRIARFSPQKRESLRLGYANAEKDKVYQGDTEGVNKSFEGRKEFRKQEDQTNKQQAGIKIRDKTEERKAADDFFERKQIGVNPAMRALNRFTYEGDKELRDWSGSDTGATDSLPIPIRQEFLEEEVRVRGGHQYDAELDSLKGSSRADATSRLELILDELRKMNKSEDASLHGATKLEHTVER